LVNERFGLDAEEREQLSHIAEIALTALSFVFLVLLLIELALPLTPAQSGWVELAGWLIWVVFAVDFIVRLALADSKVGHLKRNWLTALALVLPAFRIFRAARAVRAVRSLRLARLVTGTNRGALALRRVVGFAGAGYVVVLTVVIWLLGAAGIVYFERGQAGATVTSFPEALWWTATTLIQQGAADEPVSAEGRVLAVLLMTFALAVSGYITAVLAAYLLGRRRERGGAAAEAGPARIPEYVPPRTRQPAGATAAANGSAGSPRRSAPPFKPTRPR
jgi:voltage-gated potassium channel